MSYAEVKAGVVTNIIVCDDAFAAAHGFLGPVPEGIKIGDFHNDGEWSQREIPVIVPDSIDMRRARLALRAAGHLTAVNAAIEAMEGDAGEDARIEWEYATTIKRDHPLVTAMQQALGLSDQQLDDLFVTASQLQ